MRIARHDKICGEDFSEIDWGNVSFNGIHFSDNGGKPSKFNHSIIRKESIFYGHYGNIFFVQWSDDDKYIATWGSDGKIIIWDIETKSIKEEIEAYEPVNPFSDWYGYNDYPNSVFNFITGITNKYLSQYITIKKAPIISRFLNVYDSIYNYCEEHGVVGNLYEELSEKLGIVGHEICYLTKNKVYAIVASFFSNGPYQIVNLNTLEPVSEECHYISISKDGNQYIAVDNSWNAKVIDLKSNKIIMNIMPHKRRIDIVGFLQDNIHCFSLCYNLSSSVGDSLIIWNLKQKRMVKKLSSCKDEKEIIKILRYNLSASGVGSLFYWNLNQKRMVKDSSSWKDEEEIYKIRCLPSRIHNIEYIGFEDYDWNRYEGIKFISNTNTFDIFCVGEEGETYYDTNVYINHQTEVRINIREHIRTATLSVNEDYFIYFTTSSKIVFWEISTQSVKKRISVDCYHLETSHISSSCFSPDGTVLLVGFDNGAVYAVDSKTGETICRMEHLAFLFVDGCNFKNALMDEEIKKIIYLHGGSFD